MIDNTPFNELELLTIIVQGEPIQVFEFAGFFQSLFYHLLYHTLSPFVALPILFILNRGNWFPLTNYQMIPKPSQPGSFIQSMMAVLNSAAIIMIIIGIRSGDLEPFNYIAFLNAVFGRQCVISGKYGFYRGGHLKIFNSCPLPTSMLDHELIMNNEVFHKAGYFQKEVTMYFELENIPQDMKINIVRNKPFYTGTDQQE